MFHLLVIDDDENIRNLLCQTLEWKGFEVSEAADGIEGIKILEDRPVNLIITDINMPGKNGIEVTKEVRSRFPSTTIIAISGAWSYGKVDYLKMVKNLGAHYTFTKPFNISQLLDIVIKSCAAPCP